VVAAVPFDPWHAGRSPRDGARSGVDLRTAPVRPSNLHASARHGNKFGRTKAIGRQIKPNSHGYDNSHKHINQLYPNGIAFVHGRLFGGNTGALHINQ
jgi:hypothetical protein